METRLVNPHACQFVQSRVFLDPDTVAEYAEMFRNELTFEPCKAVITPGGATIIYDGNHRAEAAKQTGAMLEIELTPGTEQDAEWLATGANTKHGLRRSAEDIEKAVKTALRHANGQGHSDREIARHCGCDHKTVGKYRKALEASGDVPQMPTRTVQRNGAEYQLTIPVPEPYRHAVAVPYQIGVYVPPPACTPQRCDICKRRYPMGDLPTLPDGRLECFDCRHIRQEREETEAKRRDFGPCAKCGNQLTGPGTFWYDDRHQEQAICDACFNLDRRDPCVTCKNSHPPCPGCCNQCKRDCNVRQDCQLLDDDAPADREPEAEETPATRLERCQACLGKCYYTDKGIVKVDEINTIMNLVRGVTYPWPPDSQKYAAMTANFTLEDLRYEVDLRDWEAAKARKVPEPEPKAVVSGVMGCCHFCDSGFVPVEQLYASYREDNTLRGHICRSCASKALHELKEWFLAPTDPTVIADDHQAEAEHLQHEWYSRDMDKMMRAGLRIFRCCDRELLLKEYSRVVGGVGGPEYISGSWKHFERFQTKKALKERMDELEQEPNVILENHL